MMEQKNTNLVEPHVVSVSDNRRRYPRRVVSMRVGLLARGEYTADATMLEIGEGGLLLQSYLKIKVKQKVVITIRVRGLLQGVLLATVVSAVVPASNSDKHVNNVGLASRVLIRYGVQFDSVEFDIKRKIRNFVASGD